MAVDDSQKPESVLKLTPTILFWNLGTVEGQQSRLGRNATHIDVPVSVASGAMKSARFTTMLGLAFIHEYLIL